MLRKRLIAAALTIAFTLVNGYARKPGDPFKPGLNLFSKDQDVQLGLQAAGEVRQKYKVVENRELQDYVTRIGKKLAAVPEADKYPYTFTLVYDPSINAFALPGGPTFIHTGLILAADNEAQVAGVLAHEISHVALRHGTNQMSKANFLQLPAILAGVVTGSNILAQLTQLGATGFMLKFSRNAETQADLLGAKIMSRAGYNPIEMARFFEKLEAEGGSRAPQFLSDHPNPGNRVKAVEEEITAFPRTSYNASAGDFASVKNQVKQLQATYVKQNPRPSQSGGQSAQPPAPPSGNFKQFNGKHYTFVHPDSWEVFGSSDSGAVTVAPRQGIVQKGQAGAVGYGVIASFALDEDNSHGDLRHETSDLIRQMSRSNSGLRVSGEARNVTIDSNAGLMTPLVSESPFGGNETDMLLTVARPEGLFYMIFVTPEKEFRNYQKTFDDMVRSLRFSN
jgi:peptidase M48-like protein